MNKAEIEGIIEYHVPVGTRYGPVRVKQAMWEDYEFITHGGDDDNEGKTAARMIVACIVNEDGTPMFKRDEVDDVLKRYPLAVLTELGKAVRENCGAFLTNESAEGNSPTTPRNVSGTG